jgi:hypothetical protein
LQISGCRFQAADSKASERERERERKRVVITWGKIKKYFFLFGEMGGEKL